MSPVRQCESAHCSGADAEINEICKQLGWPVNHPVLTRDSQGPCTCSCSCLAHGTPVQTGDGTYRSIQDYQVGDSIMASGISLKWSPQTVEFSQGTTGASRQKYTVLVVYTGGALAVTSDHLFLMYDRTLTRADRLVVGDQLVDPGGQAVTVESVHIGDYTAGFHHVATAKKPPSKDLANHLLNTNGVVSADYTVQIFYRSGESDSSFMRAGHKDLPVVGSPEYVAAYGDASLKAPPDRLRSTIPASLHVAASDAKDLEGPQFVPAEATKIVVPEDACRFIPDSEAEAKAGDPMRAFNDPLSREWTEYLIRHHSTFYPQVVYHLDWADNTVNAYAWITNGVRHVAIKGGLVRHFALELEGIALVLAHELAHHYGGSPTFPSGLSCEGQADYHGVLVIMRNVWFGTQYTLTTDTGIAQMANFFGVPNNPTAPGGSAGCDHPPSGCRIATYHAAVRLQRKPRCAM